MTPNKSDEPIYYVYIYLDPRKKGQYTYPNLNISFLYEPFYTGKGTGYRINSHFSPGQMKRDTNLKKLNKIKSIIEETNNNPIAIKLLENVNETDAYVYEENIIKSIGRDDLGLGTLCNLTDGGDGSNHNIQSAETRKKKSDKLKGRKRPEFGTKYLTPEGRQKMRENGRNNALKRGPNSKETREKISKSLQGKPNKRSKTFFVITPSNKELIIYCLNAFVKENNLSYNLCCAVANGSQSHHKGFKFYYLDDKGIPVVPIMKSTKNKQNQKEKQENYMKNRTIKTNRGNYTPESYDVMRYAACKSYKVISPDGKEIFPQNLKTFCKENNLNYSRMCRCSTGKIEHHKNWKCIKVE